MTLSSSDSLRTWVTCASYALIHACKDSEMDIVELENSTGVSFGISSYADQYHCTRMLTPYQKFWEQADAVSRIWGIRMKHFITPEKETLLSSLRTIKNQSLILGPINMAALSYLPFSSQYKCADHYLALRMEDNQIFLTDSEGIPDMQITDDSLSRFVNINEIPEAKGLYHAAVVYRCGRAMEPKERLYETIKTAERSFISAEQNGQGGNAFFLCQRVMQERPSSEWSTSFRSDLSYYMQRKYMMLSMDKTGLFIKQAMKDHICKQIQDIRYVIYLLSEHDYSQIVTQMPKLAALESKISYNWKEWTV